MQCGRPNETAYGAQMLRLRDADEEETTNCCLFNYVSQSGWLQRRRRGRGRATSLCKTAPCNQDDNNWTCSANSPGGGSTVSGLKQGSEGDNVRVSWTDLYKSRDQAKVQACKCTMSARDHVIITTTRWSSGSSTQPGCWLPSSGND